MLKTNNIKLVKRTNYDNMQILAYITDICNYNCWYCYNEKAIHKQNLNLKALYDYIVFLKTQVNKHIDIELIGGEPSCHENIVQFCKDVYQNNLGTVFIYTNFSKHLDFYMQLVQYNVKFDITYHHTQNNKLNESVIQNILNIDEKAIRGITVMLDKYIFDTCIEMYNFLRRKKSNIDVDIQLIFIDGKIDTYTDSQLEKYNNMIHDTTDRYFEIQYSNNEKQYVSHNELYDITREKYTMWKCNAGKDLLYIHVNGNVYCCDGHFNNKQKHLFNIYETTIYPNKCTLCRIESCPFQDDICKQNIFKV